MVKKYTVQLVKQLVNLGLNNDELIPTNSACTLDSHDSFIDGVIIAT